MPATIAIILPVYNGAAHLAEVIAAVSRQTFRDWRLYIVDDDSRDNSLEIAHATCRGLIDSADPGRYSILPGGSNLGLYGRLPTIIPALTENWVSLIMQDDRPKPGWLAEMVRQRDLHPEVAALWAGVDLIDASGVRTKKGLDNGRIEVIEPGVRSWFGILLRGCVWQISGSLTRTDLFRRIPFRSDLPHCGDFDWLLRAIRTAPFLYCENPLIDLRIHQGQVSTSNLAAGRDVSEAWTVIATNLRDGPFLLSLSARLQLTVSRSRWIFIRILAALRHGDIRLARVLASWLVRFSFLFLVGREGNRPAQGHA
jgi:glycosyltransferase involved in cell wall biosynthesis